MDSKSCPAYYPLAALLKYLKTKNDEMESMWATNRLGSLKMKDGLGNYRNMWVYQGNEDQIVPTMINMENVLKPMSNIYSTFAEGFGTEVKRGELNQYIAGLAAYSVLIKLMYL